MERAPLQNATYPSCLLARLQFPGNDSVITDHLGRNRPWGPTHVGRMNVMSWQELCLTLRREGDLGE
jgi:hypothetical protein